MQLVFDAYGNVRDDIVLSMPFDPRLLLWWRPRRRLLKTEQFTFAQLGAMILTQRMLARLQIMKLGWQLAEGGGVAAKAEAHFRAVCAKWLDDATWQHVMTPVVRALQTLAKEEQASRVLEVAKEGLSPEDEEEVYETFGKAAVDEFFERGDTVEWLESPLARNPCYGSMKGDDAAHKAFMDELMAAAAGREGDAELMLRLLYTKWQLAYHIAYFLARHPEAPWGAVLILGLDDQHLAAALAKLLASSTPAGRMDLQVLLGDGYASVMARLRAIQELNNGYYAADGRWVENDDEGVEEDEEALRQKHFLRRLALSAAGRVKWMTYEPGSKAHKDKQDELESYFKELWNELGPEPTCPCCGVRMQMDHRRVRDVKSTRHPCNVTPDRLDNDVGYIRGNVRLLCLGCNLVRGGSSVAKGKEHVERMCAARGRALKDERECLYQTIGSLGYDEERDEPVIRKMAEEELARIKARCKPSILMETRKTKYCTLTVEQLMAKMRRCWHYGRSIDVIDAVFSWGFMSVDRIDLNGDYTVENMRLMHVELNGLKLDNHNDFFIIEKESSMY